MTEYSLLQLLSQVRTPFLDFVFTSVTWIGSLFVLGPLSVVIFWLARRAGGSLLQALHLPFAVTATALVVAVLKPLFSRPRPDFYESVLALPLDPAMPSGHAAQVMTFALAVVFLVSRQQRFLIGLCLLPIVLLVGLSRLYLQVHWPSDVVAGYLLGGLVAYASAHLLCAGKSVDILNSDVRK